MSRFINVPVATAKWWCTGVALLFMVTLVGGAQEQYTYTKWTSTVPNSFDIGPQSPANPPPTLLTIPQEDQTGAPSPSKRDPDDQSLSSTAAYTSAWYASRMSDPRMSVFLADSPTSSQHFSSLPLASSFPRGPRSLSDDHSAHTANKTNKKKKKKATSDGKKSSTTSAPSTDSGAESTEILKKAGEDMDPQQVGTGRTFFLVPALLYLFPVLLAQMIGMGTIPAAAFIIFPIMLLPLGLTAAIFLI